MPRKVNGTSGHSVEKHGEAIGGGPVGSAGGYSGRPGGNAPRQGGNSPRQGGSDGAQPEDRSLGGNASGLGKAAALGAAAYMLSQAAKNSSSGNQNNAAHQSAPQGANRPSGAGNGPGGGNNRNRGGLSLKKLIIIVIAAIVIISLVKSCSGSSQYESYSSTTTTVATAAPVVKTPSPVQTPAPAEASTQSSTTYGGFDLSALLGGTTTVNSGLSSSGWVAGDNTGTVNTESAAAATTTTAATADAATMRDKFYTPKSGDKVTIMVYMCGTDLESSSGMATSDLQEMASATISDDVNLLVYAGGCSGWKNNLMSSSSNGIYQIVSGGKFKTLADAGNVAMTKPETLASYIQYCAKNFPAERNILILWDHGGGSITGYGYDQKFKNSGSMALDGIDEALEAGGVKFDFIGFDACLMATAETGLMCSDYADYLVASEESEPGIGWYYTNWLTKLSNNTSIPTVELGQKIVDDFVDVCNQKCRGQDTTLSIVDLAELSATLPSKLKDFATATTAMIQNNQYTTVANARGSSKEFAASSKIDQVDLTHLAYNLKTDAGNALASVIRSAVKYNRTSSTVQNAYGLSIYFPYRSVSSVKTAVSTYDDIGIDSEYSRCIQAYATYASSGQGSTGGYSSAFGSLYGSGYGSSSNYGSSYSSGSSSYGSSYSSYDDIYSLLSLMMSGRSLGNVKGLTEDNSSFISDTFNNGTLNAEDVAQFIADNQFNSSALVWTKGASGNPEISLADDQWALVQEVMLNLFLDDGEGYIDMGLDFNSDYFTETGALNGTFDGIWMALNDWNCAFYVESIVNNEDGCTVVGRIPVLYNGQRANLIVNIVNDEPAIVGVRYDYVDGETGTIAKSVAYGEEGVSLSIDGDTATMPAAGSEEISILKPGDEIILVADYYDYDNNYQASYKISDPITVGDDLTVGYIYLADPDTANACFRFTDIYSQTYWTPVMENSTEA